MNRPSLRDLRVADLELFITAAHLKNLGKAAAVHHLSQSSASSAILRVEAAFGKQLTHHERRQFRLTDEGQLLLPRAEAWLRHLHERVATREALPLRLVTTHAIARASIAPVLALEPIELKLMRPDDAYGAVLRCEADIALVLDNAPWEGVIASEIGKGRFQLYARNPTQTPKPILLPEEQLEVLALQQRWQQVYGEQVPIKARLPSWSLIADICQETEEVGFLPDFLGQTAGLKPVPWQPSPSYYCVLALYRSSDAAFLKRLDPLLASWRSLFIPKRMKTLIPLRSIQYQAALDTMPVVL